MSKLIELRVENIQRIELAHLTLSDGVTVLSGRNAQGKSTLIDSVNYLLSGNRGLKDEHIVHGDARNGVIQGVLLTKHGAIEVRKVIRPGRPVKATYTGADGKQIDPSFIADLLPKGMVIDVPKFMAMSSRDQVDMLCEVAGIKDKLAEIQEDLDAAIEQRRTEKKVLERLEAKYANFMPHHGVPVGEFRVGELVELIGQANAENAARQKLRDAIAENRRRHAEAEAKLEQIREWMTKNDAEAVRLTDELQALGADEDVTQLQRTLDESEELQKKAQENAEYKRGRLEISAQRQVVDELEQAVQDHDAAKKGAISAADLGVEGLSFDEAGITYKGVPFKAASQAEQQIVLSALVMDPNADLKLVLAKGAALWDDDTRRQFAELCRKRGYDALIETVINSDGSIVIEDGSIAGVYDASQDKVVPIEQGI